MVMDETYDCVLGDESGTATSLIIDHRYNTAFDGGASIDPCGFHVFLSYTGTAASANYFILTNSSVYLNSFYLVSTLFALVAATLIWFI